MGWRSSVESGGQVARHAEPVRLGWFYGWGRYVQRHRVNMLLLALSKVCKLLQKALRETSWARVGC